MADDEKRALDFLKNTAKNAAKGLAEESEVYRVAENIVDNNKYLFGTVNSILNKELGVSFDVGENKEIGFMVNPNKASLNFKMNFDSGGKIGFAEAGMVPELAEMTIGGAFERMVKVGTEGSQADYRSGRNKTQQILKEIFPDVDNVMDIKIKDLTFVDAENFIRKANELEIGKNVIEKFRYAFTVSGRTPQSGTNLISIIQGIPGRMDELYPRGTKMVGTPLQNFGDNDSVIRNVNNWIDTKMNPTFKGTVKGSNVRLAKIVAETGLRPVDIVRLRPTDIDFKNGFIRYMSAKGAAGKNLPVTDEVLKLIQQQMDAVGTDNISKHGGRVFGRLNSGNTIVSAAQDAKDYESNWSKKFRKAYEKGELKIFDDAIKDFRTFRIYDFRSYHASKLIDAGQGALANDIMGWKSGKEEKIPSKMLQTVYGQTADRQLSVTMSQENINLKNAVNSKQKIIYDNIGKTSTAKVIPDAKPNVTKTIAEQVEEIQKKPSVNVTTEGATISAEGTEKPEPPKRDWTKKSNTRKILTKAAIASVISKITKAAGLIIPAEPIQAINEAVGGKEGVLPTTQSGNILGFIPPTTTKEAESWSELFGIPTYPKGHEKEGQHILSQKDYELLNQPETEKFEQEGRL